MIQCGFFLTIALLILSVFGGCNTGRYQFNNEKVCCEGYINLSIKLYNDVDEYDRPVNPVGKKHILSADRKMYLYGRYLIDVRETEHFVDGIYTKSDTTSYNLYDLVNHKVIYFNNLSLEAKILQQGKTTEFSNLAEFDPMHDVPDSTWKATDTLINRKKIGVVSFIYPDPTDTIGMEIARKSKFWVDYSVKNFPLQLSYSLSRKFNDAFVYKMQQSAPDGKAVLVTSLTYQPSNLPDSLIRIFEAWIQRGKEIHKTAEYKE